MTAETPVPGAGEIQTSPEELEQLFKEARDSFYDLPFDAGFNELCVQRGINPEDTARPRYWEAAADFAEQASAEAREAGEDERKVALRELFAATPDFIYQQRILQHDRRNFADGDAYQAAKERVSYYNGLIRYAAEECPGMSAPMLTRHLTNVANISVENVDLRQASAGIIRNDVRGAQHELAFGQLLAYSGRDFRHATVEEDLHGVDYVVTNPDGSEEFIDVKASQHTIERRGAAARPYIRGDDGQLTMQSLILDRELHDGFSVSEQVAQERGAALGRLLDEASSPDAQLVWSG